MNINQKLMELVTFATNAVNADLVTLAAEQKLTQQQCDAIVNLVNASSQAAASQAMRSIGKQIRELVSAELAEKPADKKKK